MDAQQERLEVEAVRPRDDDLPVDDAAVREVCLEGGRELREVAVERLQVAALDERLIAVAEDDRTETVPLGLEEPAIALGERGGWLRQHRLDRRLEGQVQGHLATIRAEQAWRPRGSESFDDLPATGDRGAAKDRVGSDRDRTGRETQ